MVTNRKSFENISDIHARVLRIEGSNNDPIILVANKIDLVSFREVIEEGREMTAQLNVIENLSLV